MRTLGILGGMSWESTLVYYRAINQHVARRAGGLHSASLVVHSFDFDAIAALQRRDAWDEAERLLVRAGLGLGAAGAEGLLIATNTMHKLAARVQADVGLPLLHIGDAIGAAVRAAGLDRIGLLGTRFTMEQDFLRAHLTQHHGIEVLVPEAPDRAEVHRIIFDELCRGVIGEASRRVYLDVIGRLASAGAQGVVFGCTEIGLLLDPADVPLPAFDSTLLHAAQAAQWMLATTDDMNRGPVPALAGEPR